MENKLDLLSEVMKDATLLDLSYPCFEWMPVCEGHPRFHLSTWESKDRGSVANHFMIAMGEHNGTHVDSTFHFLNREDGGKSIDEIPLEKFCGPCVTIQVPGLKGGEMIQAEQIKAWEAEHGEIAEGEIVLFCTGWGKYFKEIPEGNAYGESWPGISPEAAEYLAQRKAKLVGIDTLAVDPSGSPDHKAHRTLLPKEILILECLANLEKMPPRAWFMAFPLKLVGGSGSPMRAVGVF